PRSDPTPSSTVCHVNLLCRLATPPAVGAARGHYSLEATLSPAVAAAVEPCLDLGGVEAQTTDPLARRHPFRDPVAPPSLAEAEALLQLSQGDEPPRLGAIGLSPEHRRRGRSHAVSEAGGAISVSTPAWSASDRAEGCERAAGRS